MVPLAKKGDLSWWGGKGGIRGSVVKKKRRNVHARRTKGKKNLGERVFPNRGNLPVEEKIMNQEGEGQLEGTLP